MSYTPQRGSVPDRVIDWLRRQPAGSVHSDTLMADRFGIPRSSLFAYLKAAIGHGLLVMLVEDGRTSYGLAPGERTLHSAPWGQAPVTRVEAAPPAADDGLLQAPAAAPEAQPDPEPVIEAAPEPEPEPAPEIPVFNADAPPLAEPAQRSRDRGITIADLDRLRQDRAPIISQACPSRPLRCALWNDGTLVIEHAGQRLEMPREDSQSLFDYLDRVMGIEREGPPL